MHTVCLPLHVDLPTKKKRDRFLLNLNAYRNTHYFRLNKAKELYEELVNKIIADLPSMLKIELTFRLFMGSARSADLSNICSIVDKFFCDALVNSGKIPDDNYDVISSVNYQFGGIDKNNPRVEVSITPIVNAEDETMQITIVQSEIEDAITSYIKSQITVNDDQEISMDLRAGRGAEGYTATINISPKKAGKVVRAAPALRTVQQEVAHEEVAKETEAEVEQEVDEDQTVQEPVEPAPVAKKGVEIEVDEEGNPVKPAGSPKSLFGGLTKPTNK